MEREGGGQRRGDGGGVRTERLDEGRRQTAREGPFGRKLRLLCRLCLPN